MNKIFLTGKTGVGKSLIIEHILQKTSLSFGGFQTKACWRKGKIIGFNIIDLATTKEKVIAAFGEKQIIVDIEGFEVLGVDAISRALKEKKLVVMDELGFMERNAPLFQSKVWEALRSDKAVLGVLKMHTNDFLDRIRDCSFIRVLEVSENMKEAIQKELVQVFT
ncbi:hypothetical protein IBX65_03230 [Candidatus Aerophobetes bacterium]|nr:hypothetical protein [Candidatus Aerophobetes bacterium]